MAERTPPPTSLLWEHIKETNESLKGLREDMGAIRVEIARLPCEVHSANYNALVEDVKELVTWKSGLWMRLAGIGAVVVGAVQVLVTWVMGK